MGAGADRASQRPSVGARSGAGWVTALVAVGLLACGGSGGEPDVPAAGSPEEAAIAEVWSTYRDTLMGGDAAGMAALFTPDGVLMEPAQPDLEGRRAIESYAAETFSRARILDLTTASSELYVSGSWAFELGTFVELVELPPGPVMESSGRYAVIWKHLDGDWKIHRLMVSPLPAPTRRR